MKGKANPAADQPETLLGISLGTRSMGIALIKDRELLLWKVQCFKGCWSRSKLSLITGSVRGLMQRSSPDAVLIKVPSETRPSKGIRQLLKEIERIGLKQEVPVRVCTLSDLKSRASFSRDKRPVNKHSLIDLVAGHFPELQHEYRKEMRSRNPYHAKVFEAVACAWLGFEQDEEPFYCD